MTTDELLSKPLASFCLGGEHCVIDLQKATEQDGVFTQVFGTIKAELVTETHENALSWVVYLTNIGDGNSAQITHLCGADLAIEAHENVRLHRLFGDNRTARSFMPRETDVAPGESLTFAPVGGRPSDTTAFPFFDFTCEGQTYAVALGWTGGWSCSLSHTGGELRMSAEQRNLDTYLEPGERIRSVRVLIVTAPGSDEDVTALFRQTLRLYYSPYKYRGDKLDSVVAVSPFDRYYWPRVMHFRTAEAQFELIETARKCEGFNTLWIDAMWFRDSFPTGVGNYELEPAFGKTLKPISDKAHEAGMKLIIWFEPERVDIGSDAYKAFSDDPEFLLRSERYERDCLLNLGYPRAREWVTKTVIDFMRKNGVDHYRQDFNFDPMPFWDKHDQPGRRGMTEMRAVEGLYLFWEDLQKAFPDAILDNCASGGRRIDLETTMRTIPLFRSDTPCHWEDENVRVCTWAQTQRTSLTRYLPYHATSAWVPCGYEMRSSATESLGTVFDMLSPDFDCEAAKKALAEVNRLRPYYNGRFRLLTEVSLDETRWCVYAYTLKDSGFVTALRRDKCEEDTFVLRMPWLEGDRTYSVSISDNEYNVRSFTASGSELKNGLTLSATHTRDSFTVEYR